jgi:hypothetical protein
VPSTGGKCKCAFSRHVGSPDAGGSGVVVGNAIWYAHGGVGGRNFGEPGEKARETAQGEEQT